MVHRYVPLLALLVASVASSAVAQNAYCLYPGTGQVDQRATYTFQQIVQQADPQVMQMLIGVWQTEVRSPGTNQVDYQYRSYEPGGLFRYRSRVCGGMTGGCSDYEGVGLYAARGQGDGSFFGMLIVSDGSRDHQCVGMNGRFLNATTMVAADGTTWRRAQ